MERFTSKHLPQATRALEFIRLQLQDLVKDCSISLDNNLVNPDKFKEVETRLEKLLHETRAACSPPAATPAMTDFEVVKPLASGSFGAVSLVRHRKSRQEFALKEIKLQYPEQKDKVLLERDILAYLDNPLVVSLFCSFQTEDHMCVVMELVGGGDVGSLLRSCKRFSVDTARFYMAELISAVQYIHSCGIIHQDLKPDNLMLTNEGHIKVTDFGIAKFGSVNIPCLTEDDCQGVAEEFTDGEGWGTFHYMAPEMYLGTTYGKPVDWWATGIILYEFLYGVTPFGYASKDTVDEHIIEDEVPWPDEGYSLPPDVLSLMQQLLDKNPVTRLGTRGASEVKGHLFFQDVDWGTLHTQTPPQIPPAKVEKAPQGEATQTLDASPEDDSWEEAPAKVADFSYVAFRFREEYGSALPLSSQTPHADYCKVEKEQKMDFDGGFNGGFDYPVDDRFDDGFDDRFDDRVDDWADDRVDDWVDDRVDDQFDDQFDDRFDDQFDDQFDDRFDDRVDDRVDDQFDDRVDDRFEDQCDDRFEDQWDDQYDDPSDDQFDDQFDDRVDDDVDEDYDQDFDEDLREDYDDGLHEDFVEVDSSSLHQASVVSVDHSEIQLVDLDKDDGSTPQNGPVSHNDILQEICNVQSLTIDDSNEENILFPVEEGSSPDSTIVTVEEDCGEEDHEPEVWTCQSADVLEAATPSGFVESTSRSNWPRTAARRCRKAWRSSKAFWRRVFGLTLSCLPRHSAPF